MTYLYIDPSVATYAIQAIAGIAVAGGAIFSVVWRKVRKKMNKKLNIDENSKKEKEEEIEIID